MGNINLTFLRKILNLNLSAKEIESFKNDYSLIRESVLNYDCLLDIKKIPAFNKHKKEIIDFVEKYQSYIQEFEKNDVLYEMTNGFDVYYHWDEIYKKIFYEIQNIKKENIILLLDKLEENNFTEINFIEDFSEIYYECCRKKYNNEYEIEYYSSDGKKEYLAQYYLDSFPIVFKNAKIILVYKQGKSFCNKNEAILNTLDIDVKTINFVNSENFLNMIPFEQTKKFSKMCEYIRNLDKSLDILNTNVKSINELLVYDDLKNIYKGQLNDLNIQINKIKTEKENIIKKYCDLGYDKDIIERSLEYLKRAEWNASIDID